MRRLDEACHHADEFLHRVDALLEGGLFSFFELKFNNPLNAVRRRNLVLSAMVETGVISQTDAADASARPIELVAPLEAQGSAPYFVAAIREELRSRFGEGAETAGLQVYTGLDADLQSAATAALKAQITSVERGEKGRFRGPDPTAQSDFQILGYR